MKALLLYLLTALAEILGCYAAFLWLRHNKPPWWAAIAAVSLAVFAWLLTLPSDGQRGAHIRRLRRSVYCGFAFLALAGGETTAGSLGLDRHDALSYWSGSHLFRTERISLRNLGLDPGDQGPGCRLC